MTHERIEINPVIMFGKPFIKGTRHHRGACLADAGRETTILVRGFQQRWRAVKDEVDRAAAELWGVTGEELAEIRRSLEELRE